MGDCSDGPFHPCLLPIGGSVMSSVNDMHGKIVLVTGANSGVGFAAAAELAAAGAEIAMVCRDRRRGEEAHARIADIARGATPQLLIADLSSQAEIRGLALEIGARFDHIDVLLNNAGGVFARRELTLDGVERTFATNHLAPFLLTNLLLDWVCAAPAGRVVTVATEVYGKNLAFDNLQGEQHYQFFKVYQQSKLANILFAFELARRLRPTRHLKRREPRPEQDKLRQQHHRTGRDSTANHEAHADIRLTRKRRTNTDLRLGG
jgi:NAD(P)-dependent dehydrogenase (short-subunit alcohol dehydrogenase family)